MILPSTAECTIYHCLMTLVGQCSAIFLFVPWILFRIFSLESSKLDISSTIIIFTEQKIVCDLVHLCSACMFTTLLQCFHPNSIYKCRGTKHILGKVPSSAVHNQSNIEALYISWFRFHIPQNTLHCFLRAV